ncbi:MAG: hypothetical protein ACTSYR_05335 [Candidatus Odinarchaeia archaeon]
MSRLSSKELLAKRKKTGFIGFIYIMLFFLAPFMLGYPYAAFLEVEAGSIQIAEINTIFVITGLGLYLSGLALAILAFYIDRKPFDIEHPVRRRHASLHRFFAWLIFWNMVDILIIGLFARIQLTYYQYWAGSLNDLILRYVFMLTTVLFFMGFLMSYVYTKIIPDRSVLDKKTFHHKLIIVFIFWALIVAIFSLGIFIAIPTL